MIRNACPISVPEHLFVPAYMGIWGGYADLWARCNKEYWEQVQLARCYQQHTNDMNLIELVNYFRKNGDIENFYQSHNLNSEAEVIEIYMTKPFDTRSEVSFFEIEQSEGRIEYKSHGIIYSNLFDIYFFKDFIDDSRKNESSKLTDENLAEILLNYAINDA